VNQQPLQRQRLVYICDNLISSVVAVLLGVMMVGWVFYKVINPLTLYGWLIAALLITALRLWSCFWIRKHLDQPEMFPLIEKLFIASAAAAGLTWGIGSILFAMPTDMVYWVFLAFVVGGYASGSVFTTSASLPAFAAYFFPAILPITGWFFLQDEPRSLLMGILLLIFIAVAWQAARSANRMLLDKYTLFAEKEALFDALELRNQELKQAKESADSANAAKTRFLAAASHDMRQPMQAMRLYIDVFAERLEKDGNREIIGKLQTVHADLSRLLERCLDISRLDAGVIYPRPEQFNLNKLLHQLHEQYLPLANAAGLSFQMHLPARAALVYSDPSFVKDILANLLSNAIRYTNQGGILLAAKQSGTAMRLEIWDNGQGIEKSKQEVIFQEFVQLNKSEHGDNQGVGLGLAIASRMCHLLGGRMRVRSKPGRGSVFFFGVPLELNPEQVEESHEVRQEFVSLAGMLVFVIDDEAQIRESLGMMLKQWQCNVTICSGEQEALEAMQRMRRAPDVIITDFRLANEKTGVEAIQQLQKKAGKKIPALLLTGDTDPARVKEALDAGFPLLNKPVEAKRLRLFFEANRSQAELAMLQ